jgi:dephospho-CoA kinase
VDPGEPAWKEIVKTFGKEILNQDGTINRGRLGEIVFNDKEKRETLNGITHPRIIERIKELIEESGRENVEVVIVEAALIVEKGGMKPLINDLIVVTADEKAQIRRLMGRDRFSREAALSRIRSQIPLSEKVGLATYVIDNSGTLEETRRQVEEVWKRIRNS